MYSNFDIGYPLHGPLEEIASDYMLLSEDPKGKLCHITKVVGKILVIS